MKNKILKFSIGIVTVIVLWELLYLIINKPFVFPHFHNVVFDSVKKLFRLSDLKLLANTSFSLILILFISMALSIVLSYLAFINKYINYVFTPIISILKTTPLIIILLIILIIFGLNNSAAVIVLLVIFPVSYQGLKNRYKEIAKEFDYVIRLEKPSFYKFFINNYSRIFR